MVPNQEWKRNNFKSKENQNWHLGETVIAGIGQGYMLATPMQLAYAASIIANRGFAFKPHILKQINLKDSDEVKTESERINRMNIDDKYWDIVFDGMNAVVNEQGVLRMVYFLKIPILLEKQAPRKFSVWINDLEMMCLKS